MKNVAIVGGGPAGVAAAIYAAEKGFQVTIFEKQKKLLRKIYVTGNGTCNISNRNVAVDKYHTFGKNTDFIKSLLSKYSYEDCCSFFNSLDLPFREKDDGRAYPFSLQASHVAEILEYKLNSLGVDLKLHRRVDSIFKNKNKFKIITAGKEEFYFDNLILSAGSPAYPDLGGSKRGQQLAEKLGHKTVDFIPVILPLNIPEKQLHRLQGIKQDVRLTVFSNRGKQCQAEGELLFTKYGISGPVTLDISTTVNLLQDKGEDVYIEIDFFPEMNFKELSSFLENIFKDKNKTILFSLESILKKRIPEYILNKINLPLNEKNSSVDDILLKKLADLLKRMTVVPGENRGYRDAVTAAGGVDISMIESNTMESKKIKNLYFAGELIDVNGECGGYNLHFAWASGCIAGSSLKN